MSEYGHPARPGDEGPSDREPETGPEPEPGWGQESGSDRGPEPESDPGPDLAREDTRPLWQPGAAPSPYQQQSPYPHPYSLPPGYGYPSRYAAETKSPVPGWLWPLVAATALVIGLVGGTLGGVAVSTSMNDAGPGLVVPNGDTAAAPLEPDNGSVAAVADALLPSTVQIRAKGRDGGVLGGSGTATGSGFVLDDRGHIITNNHVVSGSTGEGEIQVIDHRGRAFPAEIVGTSATYDIAVLKADGAERMQPASLGSSQSMNVGETVVAIGSPLGLSSTVTSGIVSALDRPVTTGNRDESSYINAVQTDAAINPGNSGGPLVNLRGAVVGVNSAIATMGSLASEGGNIGVGFAIPMEQVRITADQILRTGEAKYPVIGASVNTGRQNRGAEIVEVPAGSPADEAGLAEGDIVVAVEDKPVTDGIELIVAIRSHRPGETIALRVRRDGNERTVRITLDAKVG